MLQKEYEIYAQRTIYIYKLYTNYTVSFKTQLTKTFLKLWIVVILKSVHDEWRKLPYTYPEELVSEKGRNILEQYSRKT